MPQIVWDQVGSRTYQTGLDRGVLYLPNGKSVPWNGLTSVVEQSGAESSPVYYDGMKINDLVTPGDFAAVLRAITYPDEFEELEGLGKVRNGVFVGDQRPQAFHLSYRTKIGDDLQGDEAGYRIHVLFNVMALPNDKTFATQSVDPSVVEFEWNLIAIPEEIAGFRPTAHLILDSRELDPWLLEDIEEKLYGGLYLDPNLPEMPELVTYMDTWYRWKVTDNGDGTYTLESGRGDALIFTGTNSEIFQALGVYVEHHGDGTFTIRDTYDIADIPQIKITDNGDGTWSAITNQDNLIAVDSNGYFNIFNANAVMVGPQEYRIEDSTE